MWCWITKSSNRLTGKTSVQNHWGYGGEWRKCACGQCVLGSLVLSAFGVQQWICICARNSLHVCFPYLDSIISEDFFGALISLSGTDFIKIILLEKFALSFRNQVFTFFFFYLSMKCACILGDSDVPSSKSAWPLLIGNCPGDEGILYVPDELRA